jgi:hypothetical protein
MRTEHDQGEKRSNDSLHITIGFLLKGRAGSGADAALTGHDGGMMTSACDSQTLR